MKDEFLSLRKAVIEKEFSRMNDRQKEAVFHTKEPVLILAGAGSGKTTVLVNRIANIVKYGNAYHSQEAPQDLCENDLTMMRAFLDGTGDGWGLAQRLAVDAAKPWQILAITFTNKAAGELKERLESMLGPDANDIWASTFHSACARILRREGEALGYSSHFTIYDTDDSRRVMKECQRTLGIDDKFLSHKTILGEISRAKDSMISPKEYEETYGGDIRLKRVGEAYRLYQERLKKADAMDFDDIIVNTVRLFETQPDILAHYQHRFRYIMVDEYQDTNHAQYRLTSLLASAHHNICVVGDDDQSIYRFRGATIENIMSFEEQYRDACVIRLEQNYRSTQNILDAANAVISHNTERKGKNLWTSNGEGDKIELHTSLDERDEGAYIANLIMENVNRGCKWGDHAVLYRMNAQSSAVEQAFVRMGVPYRVIGGHRFYDRKEIKDAIAYLCVVCNHDDAVRLRRIINEPKRGIGDTTVNYAVEIAEGLGLSLFEVIRTADEYEKLSRGAKKLKEFAAMIEEFEQKLPTMPLNEFFEMVMRDSGYLAALALDKETYENRLENIQELSSNLMRYQQENEDGDLVGFLEEVSLMTDIDNYDANADTVILMTIHAAKGLEFPVVFLAGMEEGVFPGIQTMYVPEEVEEERRLAYVGITRAKTRLVLSNAQSRIIFGSTARNRPSRFVEEIPVQLLERSGSLLQQKMAGSTYRQPADQTKSKVHTFTRSTPVQKSSVVFQTGDTAIHKTFGTGVVLSTSPMGNDTLLEIAFDKAGTKKLMANYAKLEKA